ncbi:MAG TPA: ABC transporter permease, partial [Longimicrobiales bacterium]|nr:ABC transporter permease [Longimicrobiales bacterium]
MTGIFVALFRGLVGLLPAGFRETWMQEAERDLDRAMAEARHRRGAAAASWVAMRGCWDVAGALPREWWRVLTHRDGNARRVGLGMGERIMNWMRELRLAARTLARRPGYATTAAVTLALGIGATVAIFTVVNAVLLRPLPYPDADRLVAINHHAPALNLPTLNNSAGTLNFYWQEADFFRSLAGFDTQQRNLVGGAQPERVEVVAATPQIFDVLGVQPTLGRPFNEADAVEGAAPVMLLTHAS